MRLLEEYSAGGDYASATAVAQQYLATDPVVEQVHQRLIWHYAVTGNRSAALRQFDDCMELLARELDVSPAAETWTLYAAVRDGKVGVEHPATSLATTSPLAPATVPMVKLPAPLVPLFGREREIATASALLRDQGIRLLTLTGSGGCGKTRLALQIAADLHPTFTHGTIFVALAGLRDPAPLLETIAQACDLPEPGVAGARLSLQMRLHDYLRHKTLLLVFDNFEHLAPAARTLADLLASAPGLHLLVTSQTTLHLSGEHCLSVPPLPIPDLAQLPSVATLVQQPALALLLARIQALNPAFQLTPENAADLATICVRLDGLPLAIELAAARLKLLSPHALLSRLDNCLALLTYGAHDLPPRQQTMRATIDWSYALLDQPEQDLLTLLAVFQGPWTEDAAEAVAGGPVLDELTSLLDKSFLRQVLQDDMPRFTMLQVIHAYARERLDGHRAVENIGLTQECKVQSRSEG